MHRGGCLFLTWTLLRNRLPFASRLGPWCVHCYTHVWTCCATPNSNHAHTHASLRVLKGIALLMSSPQPPSTKFHGSVVHAFLPLPELGSDAYLKVVFTGLSSDRWLWELRSWHHIGQIKGSLSVAHLLAKRSESWKKLHVQLFGHEGTLVQRQGAAQVT